MRTYFKNSTYIRQPLPNHASWTTGNSNLAFGNMPAAQKEKTINHLAIKIKTEYAAI